MRNVALALLRLPDGRYAFQRRDGKAPTNPHKLGLFGGRIEDGETPLEGMRRELQEETSLDVDSLALIHSTTYIASEPPYGDVQYYLYEADIPVSDFSVYEGVGMEAHNLDEVLQRDDLSRSLLQPLTAKAKNDWAPLFAPDE